jgi:hypothetical protein
MEPEDFITLFIKSPNIPDHVPDEPISLRHVIILWSHLLLGLSSGIFPLDYQTKILFLFLFSPMLATCSFISVLLALIILIIFGKEYKEAS